LNFIFDFGKPKAKLNLARSGTV